MDLLEMVRHIQVLAGITAQTTNGPTQHSEGPRLRLKRRPKLEMICAEDIQ